MTFPVTATSHRSPTTAPAAATRRCERVLTQMTPEEVTKEVTASGMLGHGGAAFPAGRKWASST